jgi:aryl-alcohol dehydrogenase-like predicted oxidoreductase
MEMRYLGRSGLQVSAVGLGCNNFGSRIDLEATRRVVHKALDLGVTLLDTADVYGDRGGSESCLGEILGESRKRVVLATKFAMPMNEDGRKSGGSRRYILEAVHDSLRRLRTDWIDLYQMHQPDPGTPIDETLRTLDDLIGQGKVRYIGCSNFAGWQVADAIWISRDLNLNAFISCQNEYSLLARGIEAELLPAARHFHLGLLPYFPLASGLLTGKYHRDSALPEAARLTTTKRLADRYLNSRNWDLTERLAQFASTRGHSLLELAISWLLAQNPVASVIAGATRPEQVEQNVAAASWKLTAAELQEIDLIAADRRQQS